MEAFVDELDSGTYFMLSDLPSFEIPSLFGSMDQSDTDPRNGIVPSLAHLEPSKQASGKRVFEGEFQRVEKTSPSSEQTSNSTFSSGQDAVQVTSEGYNVLVDVKSLRDLSGCTASVARRMSPEDRAIMLMKRKLRNRESAKRSRAKRIETIDVLQDQLHALARSTEQLQQKCDAVKRQNVVLVSQNHGLTQALNEAQASRNFRHYGFSFDLAVKTARESSSRTQCIFADGLCRFFIEPFQTGLRASPSDPSTTPRAKRAIKLQVKMLERERRACDQNGLRNNAMSAAASARVLDWCSRGLTDGTLCKTLLSSWPFPSAMTKPSLEKRPSTVSATDEKACPGHAYQLVHPGMTATTAWLAHCSVRAPLYEANCIRKKLREVVMKTCLSAQTSAGRCLQDLQTGAASVIIGLLPPQAACAHDLVPCTWSGRAYKSSEGKRRRPCATSARPAKPLRGTHFNDRDASERIV
ncbi:Cyclic AMP-responsive element-binding protein 3-like protein 4 [Porphyridium purpureum]|uniref:Cyclic AMP-responsive element-binding protein 3-like protein 4 n=1 Tax=Porphyridium purpureum TaxID=35688 RepID=A0A5J4Z904_PORPP|nr:Cyclic AMP-responsive element-binding protein 3-like protein 4 [Porphyridium purpureum]|eukprot:POR6753..scf295_1